MNTAALPFLLPFMARLGKPALPWKEWRLDFEDFLLVIDGAPFAPTRKKDVLLHALGTEGQRIYHTLPGSGNNTLDEFEATLATRELRYADTYNVIAKHSKLQQRGEGLDEGVEDFITGLRGLAIACDYRSTQDENLRDQLVEKAFSSKVRECLLLEGSALAWDKAIWIAVQVEKCDCDIHLMPGDSTCVQNVRRTTHSRWGRIHILRKSHPRAVLQHVFTAGH